MGMDATQDLGDAIAMATDIAGPRSKIAVIPDGVSVMPVLKTPR